MSSWGFYFLLQAGVDQSLTSLLLVGAIWLVAIFVFRPSSLAGTATSFLSSAVPYKQDDDAVLVLSEQQDDVAVDENRLQ
uniref:Uncharacterized protein n=1 Tax=Romanomermis culicivorax TaxID=13658 RepID=A0A915KCQ1_ROMCU